MMLHSPTGSNQFSPMSSLTGKPLQRNTQERYHRAKKESARSMTITVSKSHRNQKLNNTESHNLTSLLKNVNHFKAEKQMQFQKTLKLPRPKEL